MLCSKCSHEVKPIVAVDIDGTLGDYHEHFLRFTSGYFDMFVNLDYTGGPFKSWWMDKHGRSEKDWHDAKLAYRQGGMKRTMPIFDGARALCWAIRDAGAELWMTTTRPYLSLDNIVPDTVEWLRRHEIECDGMLFDEDKYAVLANRVDSRRVVAVLDDLPEQIDAAAAALEYGNDVPLLVKNRWNAAARAVTMCDLDSAADIVLARIEWWKEQNGS